MTLLELKNIKKFFGKVHALDGVNLEVKQPEVLALLGDNGAGKSTLAKITSGVYAPSSGEIYFDGKLMTKWDVQSARSKGVETVYQDRALTEQQSIASNIFMGRELSGSMSVGFINLKKQYEEADNLMREIGLTSKAFNAKTPLLTLSGGELQGVAIARALYFKARLVILDEPVTSLSLSECEKVYNFIDKVKKEGLSCILICHNIYQAYDAADRFVVLDRGRDVLNAEKKALSAQELIDSMQKIARNAHIEEAV
ncbi:Fructose import ATP-binding protein FrcA [subsurface metagenome]